MGKYAGVVNTDVAMKHCQEYEQLAGARGNWESHWQEIAERVVPSHTRLFSTLDGQITRGEKRNELIFDSTASIALKRFASILDSLLTPRNQTWHRLQPSDSSLMKNRQVLLWFEDVNRLLLKYRYAAAANFSSQNQQNYISLGAYGTGCVYTDELSRGGGLRYRNIHLGEIFFSENHQGIVDKAYRKFAMTARQIIQKWGDKAPRIVVEKAETNTEHEYHVIHAVVPREDLDPTRKDYRGMAYASYYVMKEGYSLLEEGGYTSFPYAISRYEQSPGEIYGRSPAMDVLPAIKTLNEEKKTVLKQGHRAVDPIYLMSDDGVFDAFSAKPGTAVPGGVNSDGRPLVHTLQSGNIAIGKELMDDERAVINDAFLVTIFQILVDTPAMTATEVIERTREKGILLAPTIGRQQTEYLGPLIEREIDILSAQGLLPPMPKALVEAKGDYRIEYDSPISRTQRAEEASGVMRTIESALQVVNVTQNPDPLDHFDWDVIIPEMSAIQGVPAKWMRSIEGVQKIREARAQNAQAQQDIQAGPAAAAMVKAQASLPKQG
jgi:hypothetical protein